MSLSRYSLFIFFAGPFSMQSRFCSSSKDDKGEWTWYYRFVCWDKYLPRQHPLEYLPSIAHRNIAILAEIERGSSCGLARDSKEFVIYHNSDFYKTDTPIDYVLCHRETVPGLASYPGFLCSCSSALDLMPEASDHSTVASSLLLESSTSAQWDIEYVNLVHGLHYYILLLNIIPKNIGTFGKKI